jgi:hypothetical protein
MIEFIMAARKRNINFRSIWKGRPVSRGSKSLLASIRKAVAKRQREIEILKGGEE